MVLTRTNDLGLMYELYGDPSQSFTIIRCSNGKQITVNTPIEIMNQAWYYWMNGELIQNVFHMLTPNEREFIMTGITQEEWTRIFGDENDD